jgi:hypothetical protein
MTSEADNAALLEFPTSIGDEQRILGFEADFARDLRCIPMAVRFKLDRCRVKLSLRQWSRFGADNRRHLLERRCDSPAEIAAYERKLVELIGVCGKDAVVLLPLDPHPEWNDVGQIPAQVISQAMIAGVAPPSLSCWRRLSTLERFALLKLARSNHDNHNFLLALREFGIAT